MNASSPSHRLDITPLKASVEALANTIGVYNANLSGEGIVDAAQLKEALRSAVIHNFETAYELCWKFMKMWLEENISPDIVKSVPRREFYRIAHQNGLISEVVNW